MTDMMQTNSRLAPLQGRKI